MLYLFIVFEILIFGVTSLYTYRKLGSFITFYKGNPTKTSVRIIRAAAAAVVGCICMNLRHVSAMVAIHAVVLFAV